MLLKRKVLLHIKGFVNLWINFENQQQTIYLFEYLFISVKRIQYIYICFTSHFLFSFIFLFSLVLPFLWLGDQQKWGGYVHSDLAPDITKPSIKLGLTLRQTPRQHRVTVGTDLLLNIQSALFFFFFYFIPYPAVLGGRQRPRETQKRVQQVQQIKPRNKNGWYGRV